MENQETAVKLKARSTTIPREELTKLIQRREMELRYGNMMVQYSSSWHKTTTLAVPFSEQNRKIHHHYIINPIRTVI